MSSLKQILRHVTAALCGLSCLGSMPGFPGSAVAAMMHGEHTLQVAVHDGHEYLLLHHDDDGDDGQQSSHEQTHVEEHDGHHHHRDHVICLPSSNHAATPDELIIRAPMVRACVIEFSELVFVAEWTTTGELTRARPPPIIGGGVLVCMRSTVLVV